MAFTVYRAINDGLKFSILALESRIEQLAEEMAEAAKIDDKTNKKIAALRKVERDVMSNDKFDTTLLQGPDGEPILEDGEYVFDDNNSPLDSIRTEIKAQEDFLKKQEDGGRSTTEISLELQMYIQQWSFMLTMSTNLLKTFGDGLLSLARNL